MNTPVTQFHILARCLHWLMAIMIVAMLFIGIGMVSTAEPTYRFLLAIHKPLGIAIGCLVLIRLIVRFTHATPPLPADLPRWQKLVATGSHVLLYLLMLAMPLIGWAMLSAGGYPIVLWGALHLPPIAPVHPSLFAFLRQAHTYLALLLLLTFLLHLGAALFHTWIRRDEVLPSMTLWRSRRSIDKP
jgi:cytochrome b561